MEPLVDNILSGIKGWSGWGPCSARGRDLSESRRQPRNSKLGSDGWNEGPVPWLTARVAPAVGKVFRPALLAGLKMTRVWVSCGRVHLVALGYAFAWTAEAAVATWSRWA